MVRLERLLQRAACAVFGHDWELTHRTGDWLDGATYSWRCRRPHCRRRLTSKPRKV